MYNAYNLFGIDFVFTEMVSGKAILRKAKG